MSDDKASMHALEPAGDNGLPLGLRIAARPRQDERLLAIAAWLEQRLATKP